MAFVHLHVHSDFSCLDGFGMVSEYAAKAKANNVKYLVITDHGVASSIPQVLEQSTEHKLTPVFGSELYLNNYHHLVPEFSSLSDEDKFHAKKNYHILLLAKNEVGYKNLIKLTSEGWINGFYYKPRVSFELLKKHSEGIICGTACIGSEFGQLILKEKHIECYNLLKQYKDVFQDDFFIEIQMNLIKEQSIVNQALIMMGERLDIQIALTNDTHYCDKHHSAHHEVQLLLNSKGTINNKAGLEFHTDQLWYKTEQELDEMWLLHYADSIPKSVYDKSKENTVLICDKCDVTIDTNPKFPEIENAENEMLQICIQQMKDKNMFANHIYYERFLREYELISKKGFTSYFMVVKKIVDWCYANDISVGAARGSGAGSLICYLLDITQVDPLKYNLLFERFLSPSRGGKFAKLQFNSESEINI